MDRLRSVERPPQDIVCGLRLHPSLAVPLVPTFPKIHLMH